MGKKALAPIRVFMVPSPHGESGRSGIATVIRSYGRLADRYGIQFVDDAPDVTIAHAGVGGKCPFGGQWDVSMLHGIYFTGEGPAGSQTKAEWRANRHVIDHTLQAISVTVPSDWVAQTLRKEFKIDPYIIEHGVFWIDWQHGRTHKPNQIFWGKNRIDRDVCDPAPFIALARRMPDLEFVMPIAPSEKPDNVRAVGILGEDEIRRVVQESALVMSTVKETWGLLYAEAMAAGTPVVTVNSGHVPHISPHGVTGYSYAEGDIHDMENGVRWALEHRGTLSENARVFAKGLSWDRSMSTLRKVLEHTMSRKEVASDGLGR